MAELPTIVDLLSTVNCVWNNDAVSCNWGTPASNLPTVAIWSAVAATCSAIAAVTSAAVACTLRRVKKQELVAPFVTLFSELHYIDPTAPNLTDVRKALNAMEYLAGYYQSGALDYHLVKGMFGKTFKNLYDQISNCNTLSPTGAERLERVPALKTFYDTVANR